MFAPKNFLWVDIQLFHQRVANPEFVGQPDHAAALEGLKTSWEVEKLIDEYTLKFLQRLFVEDDVVNLIDRDAGMLDAPSGSSNRYGRIVLESAEPLFAGRGNDHTVAYQCRGRVMVLGRNSEDCDRHDRRRNSALELCPFENVLVGNIRDHKTFGLLL